MNYDPSQFDEILKRISSINSVNIKDLLTPEMQNLLNSALDMRSTALLSQEYVKNLKLQFPKIFSLDIDNDAIVRLSKQLTASIPSVISETFKSTTLPPFSCNIDIEELRTAMARSVSSITKATGKLNIPSDETDEDYITANETTIKEWNIPNTVAVPIGHHRIRMRTDIFITILSSIIIPILLWIAGQIVDLHDAYNNAKTETQRIELEQERND